jgi:hypothetical protein
VGSPRGENNDAKRRFVETNYAIFREQNQRVAVLIPNATAYRPPAWPIRRHGRCPVRQLEMSQPLTYQNFNAGLA